ncbi:MAG: G/U mismatch-specific DNA glycosylase [Acidobacteria bacterium]|nr:G/U mismatch-specific DNA glycosylase [Acidobacteriota bacterium]
MLNQRPTKQELLAAAGKTLPDVIAGGLRVLFCGINPGLYTAAVGHHFARPGNRFWPSLYKAGFTDRLLSPYEEDELLELGYGITNLVARATASAAELGSEEYVRGARILEKKVQRYRPGCVAFVGIGAYRVAFGRPNALIGRQPERLSNAMIWTLPSTSGLNANHRPDDLARLFAGLHKAVRDG